VSSPNAEGLPLTPRKVPENPDARPVTTVELPPHILVTDEMIERFKAAVPYWTTPMLEALNDAAAELWQAGCDGERKRIVTYLREFKSHPVVLKIADAIAAQDS